MEHFANQHDKTTLLHYGGIMSRDHIHFQPAKNADIDTSFDDMYYDISRDRRRKAKALQIRRWRALKHEVKGGY